MLDIILSGLALVVSAALIIAYWRHVRQMPLSVRAQQDHAEDQERGVLDGVEHHRQVRGVEHDVLQRMQQDQRRRGLVGVYALACVRGPCRAAACLRHHCEPAHSTAGTGRGKKIANNVSESRHLVARVGDD